MEVGNFGGLAVVFAAMEALALALPEPALQPEYESRRFSSDGVVIVRDSIASVYIGGTLIGAFDLEDEDRGPRNVLAVTLAKSDQFNLGRLASAFGITDEYLRRLRRREEAGGLAAPRASTSLRQRSREFIEQRPPSSRSDLDLIRSGQTDPGLSSAVG
jgi:hypothetical protein